MIVADPPINERLVRGGHYLIVTAGLQYGQATAGETPGKFRDKADRWNHALVGSILKLVRPDRASRRLFEDLEGFRVRADYFPTSVDRAELDELLEGLTAWVQEATQ